MSFLDIGYDEFFSRSLIPEDQDTNRELSSFDFASQVQGMSFDEVVGGVVRSNNGNLLIDLTNNSIIITDGRVQRVRLGQQEDGTVGFLVKDENDNELIRITGETNIIQSPTTNLQIDLDEERILVKDETGTPRVLVGKHSGGF